jgi:replicative DNA helicase
VSLTLSTRISRADNGGEVIIGELMERGEHSLVWTLDKRKRLRARPMCEALYSCRAGVFRVRLTSGREIEVTADQQLSTLDGWTPLSTLTVGDRLAVARRVPDPINRHRMADA